MTRNRFLLLVTLVGSAVCWWPAIIEPSLDFPRWILPPLVVFLSGTSILLSGGRRWRRFVLAATAGSFAGLLSGFALWPSPDGIANSYALIIVVIATVITGGAALICGFTIFQALARWPRSNRAAQGIAWALLVVCLAFGPTLLAVTRPLVVHRVMRNENIAGIRFASLKNALELTRTERAATDGICDGRSLQKHYSGPPFTQDDWSRICGNYVEEEKYVYAISDRPPGNFLLEARPKMPRAYGYGARVFCADISGDVACDPAWNR